ncbi:type II toxin-antitoxin system RelE family toxin [Halomonas sp.]|uniref:type II toxin-antitoxin system RelE family toxin n=1 Tax=unclassified Halomonas TaxID=2609666 RepID=UPI003F93DD54
MGWKIELTGAAHKQLKKLGHVEAKRIRDYLRERVQPRGPATAGRAGRDPEHVTQGELSR